MKVVLIEPGRTATSYCRAGERERLREGGREGERPTDRERE